ncbi:centromere protein F [Neopelma chrysocephalum]|uniref:centromere protein F n=1 Tax=Neopelma chrysocephalum TaxID=114329 RepID=UPI000FCD1A4C|nr:centromere protein F [Neopelma chrysocephalum]
MSWAVEEWKEGLSPRVLQKIHELESQVDKLKKERQQRQYQLETLEAALQKQKQKVENEKNESTILKRENQSLMELCDNLEKAKQKISHDLQVKESQVNIQSGQLNSSKKDIERLEQELKRYKCELERSQQTSIAGDVSLSGTPQQSFTAPLTPVQSNNGAKFEELEEKYKKKVQENKELELQLRTIQLKKINQPRSQSSLSHREIARHQASSSVFSWQQEKTPSKNQETPARGSSAASSFLGEKETNSSIISEKNEFDNSFFENCNSSLMIQLKAQNQELNSTIKDLEQQLQAQEKVNRSHMNKHQETELELDRMKLELTEKDKALNKTRDKLTQTRTQLDQATTQVQMMEQKVKRLSEELNCQRQNAESVRQSLEQKIKAKEKEYQQELSCQQRSLQTLDQQCNQIRSKLNQELQQAKNDFNILQAEFDKVMAVKQHLEHNTSDLTQKLCRAEQALSAAQAKETDLTKSFEEVKQEKNRLNCQLEKKLQEIHQLEKELNTIKQSLKQSQNFAEEMKNKNTFQEAELKLLEEKFKKQESSLSLEKLKIALADMEKQRDSMQDLLKEKDNHIKEQDSKIRKMEEEAEALQRIIGFKQRECDELQKEAAAFSQWKNETDHLINKLKSEKEGMLAQINDLESSLQSQQIKNHEHSETFRIMQTESDRKTTEIKELKDMLECKSAELEEQKKAFNELEWKAECSDKKYCKEIENMSCKIFQLTNQVAEVEEKLQLAASEGLQREQCYHDLLGEYEKICCLVKAKDTSEMTEDGQVNLQSGQDKTVSGNMQLAANNSNPEDHRCAGALLEAGKAKDLANLREQISSLEISLVAQKQLNSNQQQQYEDLLQIKGETEQRLLAVEEMHRSFVMDTEQHISNLQADISARQKLVEKTLEVLEEKDMQLQTLNEKFKNRQAELQDLKINNKLLEDSVRQLELMSRKWDSEKKDMSSMICSYSKKIGELTKENATLRDLNCALKQEQVTLLEANKNIYNSLKEREEIISEMSAKHEEERQRIESRTEEIKTELEALQAKYKLVEEENGNVMSILREEATEFEQKKAKLEQEKQVLSENKDILRKLIASEEIKKDLVQELQQLQSEFSNVQHVPSMELDCLSQETLNARATQNTMQEKCGLVFQDKEQLGKELQTKHEPLMCEVSCEQRLCSERLRKSMEEKDIELNKYQVKLELLQMDFEDSELSLENYRLEVMQLETALKGMEVELEKSVREKERLQQELLSVKELKTSDSSLTVLEEDDNSLGYNYNNVSRNSGKRGMDESYSSVLLASSLQETINHLSELEKMCERLQSETIALASGFKDTKNNGITSINKVEEEKENIMNTDKNLKAEKAILPDELMDQSDHSDLRMYSDNKEISFRLKECSTPDYKDLKLSRKEVKIGFAEIRERLSTFQNEHIRLYEQHCSMSSKICELQSCIEILKAENSALSTSLSNAHIDSVRVSLSSIQDDTLPKLDETKSTSSSSDLSVNPYFIEVSKVVDSHNSAPCKWTEEINQLESSAEVISEGTTKVLVENCHNDHKLDSVRELRSVSPRKSNLESRIEELQMLCQTYEKAIKVLEDQFHVQENMKNEEIQELKEVILTERKEIDHLKQQNLSDKEEWQQKLNNMTMEMECKLAAERKQTENLSLELEAARLQLQVLDLSSHSLLCTDIENNAEQENNSPYRLGVPIENSSLKSNNLKTIPIEKMTAGDASVCENVTKTTEVRLMEDYTEKISGEQECINMSGKINSPSVHGNALSFSSSSFLGAGDFYENQITTETLQEEANQQTAENLKLIYETEESHKCVDLIIKVEQLNSELNFQNAQLISNNSAFTELEKATAVVKEENCDIKEKHKSVSVNKQQLSLQVVSLEKEPVNVKSEVELYKVRLSNAADMLDDVEMTKRDCHEQFLAVENERRSPKSDQVKTENHALFIEHDIEMLQAKCHQLEREREVNLKTISSFQEHLVSVTAERNHIGQELSILSENKKELDHKYQKLQEKLKELESTKVDSTEFIRRLEGEVRTQANLLETAKSDVNQLSNEKYHLLQKLQSLENDAVSFALEKEKFQNEAADLKKEKELMARELEMMQSKLSSSEMENSKLSRSLESLLMEKGELASRFSVAQKEVDELRHGIEKLKVKIESDEKKKRHIAEKLKESERKADSLLDKIERLERELEMSEKNLEDAIIQVETAKAETETLVMEMEETTEKLKCSNLQIDVLTSQKQCLAKDLKEMQEKFLELESANLSTAKLLEEKEEEKMQIKDEFENTVVLLRSELKDMSEKLEFSCKEEADARAKEQVLVKQVARLEQDKTILLQQCQEIKDENIKLDQTKEVLVQELMDCKQKLNENVQENGALQKQVKETEELSLQLTHMHHELECWRQEKKGLQNLIAELKLKEQHFSDNETFPDILNVLKMSYKDLEKQLESTLCEKNTLCKKVNELTESHTELQVKLSNNEQMISKLQEERNKLAEEIQCIQEHSEKNKIQLHLTMSEKSELTKSLETVQNELQEKESEMKREISEYKDRLLQAEKEHQDRLTEANRKNDVEIEACHEKISSLEHFISSQKLEIEHLKSNKEQLNNSLKEANQALGELLKIKADNSNILVQLKKENEFAHSEVQLWMKSCKQMEEEKEMLQKQLVECEELLKKKNFTISKDKKEGDADDAVAEEIKLKLEELQESTEVKTREANENLEKYCSLIVKYYKLEEENEMLKTQVNLLSAQLKQPTSDAVSSPLLNSDHSLTVSNQSVKEIRSDEDTTKLSNKRQRCEDNKKDNREPRSPAPETSSKKKRKCDISQNLLGQEDTDSKIDGLPEVVQKGFADIPTGKSSPYILRRTTLHLRTSPHLASSGEKQPLPKQDLQRCRPDHLGERSCPTPGGSKPQKENDEQQSQAVTAFPPKNSTSRSPLCLCKQSTKPLSDNTSESHMMHKAKNSLNEQGLSEQDEQKENCKVQ